MILVDVPGGVGRLEEDGTVALLDLPQPTLGDFLTGGGRPRDAATAPVLRRLGTEEVELGPGLAPTATVWGVGMNYRSKQLATGRPEPDEPVLFVKARSAFPVSGHDVPLPEAAPGRVDYEGEIAVVVGLPLHCCHPAEAARAVTGAMAAADFTARDVMKRTGNPSLAKGFPGFGQLGGAVTDVTEATLTEIPIATLLGSRLVQSDSSAGMLLPIADLIALLSRYVVLRPGDVVLTGTPAGTGDERGEYLAAGDVVEVRVADLPPLTCRVTPCGGR